MNYSESDIEQWKIKKMIKTLETARGSGTSMISLVIPPGDQISRVIKMLTNEMGDSNKENLMRQLKAELDEEIKDRRMIEIKQNIINGGTVTSGSSGTFKNNFQKNYEFYLV